MSLLSLAGPELQEAATVFAREFKRQGVFGGGVSGSSSNETLMEKSINIKKSEYKVDNQLLQIAKDDLKTAIKEKKSRKEINELRAQEAFFLKQTNKNWKEQIFTLPTFGQKIRDVSKEFFNLRTSLALLGTGAVQAANDFKASLKFGDTLKTLDRTWRAAKMGIDPGLISELQAQNRASVLAMGGAAKWADTLSESQQKLYKYTGDNTEAARLAADAMQTMRIAGINATTAGMESYAGELVKIHKMTGMVLPEVGVMIRRFTETDEIRSKLLSTQNKQRRQGMMMEITQRHQLLVGMGMMTEQAEAAARTLDAIAGKGPRERMKEAAQAAAALGALGMGAEGAELQKIMQKGLRASPAEQKRAAEILGEAQGKMSAAQMGDLSKEMAYSAVIQKTGLDGVMKQFGILGDPLNEGVSTAKTEGEKSTAIVSSLQNIEKIMGFIKDNPYWKLALGSLSFIGTTLATMLAMKGMGKLGIGNMAAGMGGGVAGAAKVAGGLAIAGAAGYAFGTFINDTVIDGWIYDNKGSLGSAIYDWLNEEQQTVQQKMEKMKGWADDWSDASVQQVKSLAGLSAKELEDKMIQAEQMRTGMATISMTRRGELAGMSQNVEAEFEGVNKQLLAGISDLVENPEMAKRHAEMMKYFKDQSIKTTEANRIAAEILEQDGVSIKELKKLKEGGFAEPTQ